jgi:hypothetical protein
MRAMQSPWGSALMVIGAILIELLVVSAITALFALAVFLIRRSRLSWPVAVPPAVPPPRLTPGPATPPPGAGPP